MKIVRKMICMVSMTVIFVMLMSSAVFATSQSKSKAIPGNQGTIVSNAYRNTFGTASGHTMQWDYQVSAEYKGAKAVSKIRTSFVCSVSMRFSGSVSIGISNGGATASSSASWQTIQSGSYRENINGSTMAWFASNMIASPKSDYRTGTAATVNEARVTLKNDPVSYPVNAGV